MSQFSSDSQNEFRFEAQISEPNKLIPMLKSIHIMKTTVMSITSRGLKLTCQELGRCLQANSFIDRSIFTRYYMSSESTPISVCFRLTDLLNALTIFSQWSAPTGQASDHCLKVKYTDTTQKLTLELSEDNVKTKVDIKTFVAEDLMVFNMDCVNKVILNPEPIVHFWKSSDFSSDAVEIAISADGIRWTTESERAKVNHNIMKDSEDVEQFIHSMDVQNKYKLSLMKFTLKALIHSSKLSLRFDCDGLLSLQFLVKLDHQFIEHCFVEYFICPQIHNNLYELSNTPKESTHSEMNPNIANNSNVLQLFV